MVSKNLDEAFDEGYSKFKLIFLISMNVKSLKRFFLLKNIHKSFYIEV